MAYLLYRENMSLLIKPDFINMNAILRVNIGHIGYNRQGIQKLKIVTWNMQGQNKPEWKSSNIFNRLF
jgi:hypothetical protein